MTAFPGCRGPWRGAYLASTCLAVAIAAIVQHPAFAADPLPVAEAESAAVASPASVARELVTVHIDQAAVLRVPERTVTLVVGNPLIADAVVQPGGVVVITAKSYGMTNLVALDRTGSKVAEHPIQVVGPSDKIVVVYRGIERESYSCAPNCERRITIGDTPAFLTQNLTQVGTINALAQQQPK